MKDELSGKCLIQIDIPTYLFSNNKYKIHVELSMKLFFINTDLEIGKIIGHFVVFIYE